MEPALTVRDVLLLYLRHSEASGLHGQETLADRQHVFGLFADVHGDLPVTDCKPFHLTDFIQAHPTWKSLSTQRSKANAIRAAFQWAARQERIDRNPFLSVTYGEAEPRPPLGDDVLQELLVCSNKRFERVVRFLRLTGCRLGELTGLTWPAIDLEKGLARIERHKTRKRTQKAKLLILVPEAVELLRKIQRTQKPDYQGVVFLNTRGTPWNRRTLGQTLRRMKTRGEVSTAATLHGLRHQWATKAIASGAPLSLVSAALGHSSSAVTERYYVDLSREVEAIRSASSLAMPTEGELDG